jgi:undecaprenyl diphosphate synthase
MVFSDILWPDVDRLAFWSAIEEYARRNRRYGSA